MKIVHQVESRLQSVSTPAPIEKSAQANSKTIQGELVAHGAAPYKHEESKQPSAPYGVWGLSRLQDKELVVGDLARLQDHHT